MEAYLSSAAFARDLKRFRRDWQAFAELTVADLDALGVPPQAPPPPPPPSPPMLPDRRPALSPACSTASSPTTIECDDEDAAERKNLVLHRITKREAETLGIWDKDLPRECCGSTRTSHESRLYHHAVVHMGVMRVRCGKCGSRFPMKRDCAAHVASVHRSG